MRRVLTTTCTALYCFAMIGLIGGIGVMASGAATRRPRVKAASGSR